MNGRVLKGGAAMLSIAALTGELVIAAAVCLLAVYRSDDQDTMHAFYCLQPVWILGYLTASLSPGYSGGLSAFVGASVLACLVGRRELYDWQQKRDAEPGVAAFNTALLIVMIPLASVVSFVIAIGVTDELHPLVAPVLMALAMVTFPVLSARHEVSIA